MWKLFRGTKALTVRVCERCGEVCDDRCRRQASHERALLQQAWLGVRV